MAAAGSILGNAVARKEDPGLLTGSNQYVDDLKVTNSAQIIFVRSPMAHGTIKSVDVSDAEGMPGVIKIYTAANTNLPDINQFPMMPATFDRPAICGDKVRFVGDIIAVVVAENLSQGIDAANMVFGDIDPLDAVIDLETAAGAAKLFDEAENNVCFATAFPLDEEGNQTEPNALDGSDFVGEVKMVTQRLAGAPMEPNGCVANPVEGKMDVWVSHQAPHSMHEPMAALLGMEKEMVRIVTPWVGGGFGPKAAFYNEYFLTAMAAKDLGRAVTWTEIRSENMVSMVHGRAMVMEAKLGIKSDGTFTGMEANVIADAGAYPALGAILPMLTQLLAPAVYTVPKLKFNAITVLTTTTSIGAYRGAGRPEATQLIERAIDVAAAGIGMDPAEVRRKNFLPAADFPLTTITGANYDSGEYEKALDAALEASGYSQLRADQAARRESGDVKQLGIGIGSYVEVTAPLGLHVEYSKVEVHEDGTASMYVGTSAHGQGHDTAFSMLVSEQLGIPMDKIKHVQSDTDAVRSGVGTMGSRSLQTAGSGVYVAAEHVLNKAKELAAHLLEASVDDIEKTGDGLGVAGVPTSALSWSDLARAAADDARRPDGMDAGLEFEHDWDQGDSTFPFGTHVSVVEVDTDTGGVEILRHIAVDDCGTILNPMLVRGQQHGGIAQGVAQVLFEHVQYDELGNPQTANLMDYLVPSAAELPSFEASNTETASPRNPIGAKGVGESGTIGSTPALHNAVVDAVAHLGVQHIDMPCTPQAIFEAIQAAQ